VMHRASANPRRSRAIFIHIAAIVLILSTTSSAYNEGGHFYTVSAVLYESRQNATPAQPDALVQAFCAQLPDLAMELDAITQRLRVLKSGSDWQWGLLGRCGSSVSRHMVVTQFYLHGLTGAPTEKVRLAAAGIVRDIDIALAGTASVTERMNLWCARGFAAHLLGDTYAHSRLDKPDEMYPTGAGHGPDGRKPDYMLARAPHVGNQWTDWVQFARQVLDGKPPGGGPSQIAALAGQLSVTERADDYGEKHLRMRLEDRLRARADWKPYDPEISRWLEGNDGFQLTARCQDQSDKGPVGAQNGKGLPLPQSIRPNCSAAWDRYLRLAVKNFPGDVSPDRSCAIRATAGQLSNKLEDGQ